MTPSPVMATTLPWCWKALTIFTLCSGETRAKTRYWATRWASWAVVQAVQLLAGEHLGGALRHAQALGDGKGCGGVVAGNHHRQNARALALGHRLLDAGAGRVLHGDEAAEHQAAFCLAVVGGEGFHVFIGHGQHPQGPAG